MQGLKAIESFLKTPHEKTDPVTLKGSLAETGEEIKEETEKDNNPILCRQCGQRITLKSYKREVSGAHCHTFANPLGVVFEIGCFKEAPGCALVGDPSDEFSWFRGFVWRAVFCMKCMEHLGWLFSSRTGDSHFFGLIIDRLVEIEY